MPAQSLTARAAQQIARPLKVLIPLIQSELQQGNTAGREHYRRAGEMLSEAKDQVGYGGWRKWLKKNFHLSHDTASHYMRMARVHAELTSGVRQGPPPLTLRELTGQTARERERYNSKQQQQFRRVLREVARDEFVQERQDRKDEVALHQDLAVELVEIGYRALATRLHPDRGGTKDAMARLNRVRDELKHIAQTRRFV